MRFFFSIAASVGWSPIMPITAVTTVSASSAVAAARRPSMPESTWVFVSESRAQQLTRRILVIKHGKTRAKFPRLLFDEVNALIRRQRSDGKPQLARHLKRLAADGAGGTE